jgi:hypothetical protein
MIVGITSNRIFHPVRRVVALPLAAGAWLSGWGDFLINFA